MDGTFDPAVISSGEIIGPLQSVRYAARGPPSWNVWNVEWDGCRLNRGSVSKKDKYHTARLIAPRRDFAGRGIQGGLTGSLAERIFVA